MNRRRVRCASRWHRHPRGAAGFTFLDLVLVAVIVSVLAAVGVPMMQSALVEFRLGAAADEIITAVEYAQMTALASGCQTRVSFDVSADTVLVEREATSLRLVDAPGTELGKDLVEIRTFEPLEHPLNRGSDYRLSLAGGGWSGSVDLSKANFGATTWVVFDARGHSSSGGTAHLDSEGRRFILLLDDNTGRMTLQ